MASKNNPMNRQKKLIVLCPDTNEPMKIIKRVPGGKFFYKSEQTGKYYPVSKGSYKTLPHKWERTK